MDEKILIKSLHSYFPFGFLLSRMAWEDYEIRDLIDRLERDKAVPGIFTLRKLADRFNRTNYQKNTAFEPIHAGQLISVGVIVDILRYIIRLYCHDQNKGVLPNGLNQTGSQYGREIVNRPPPSFVNLFPPTEVVEGEKAEDQFLRDNNEIASNLESAATEMILLTVSMANPAFRPFRPLFDDQELRKRAPYLKLVDALERFFDKQPAFDPLGEPLFKCLRAPLMEAPDSLDDQLAYIRKHWAAFLPPDLLEALLLASDILREEEIMRGFGPGPNIALKFGKELAEEYGYAEPARFSRDADWMSNVVIIAKTVYVWLDQLSKKYQRHIKYLSDVPDQELDRLARWGFSGLWLIGLWERSPASQKIKQIMGNPEAAPSAYSLYDYTIAEDLGGEEAYQNLKERAWRRGIRLASDMVPNHMGIYSRWMIEHPDWFVQLDYPPFPVYQYNGEDLSWDGRVCLQIEDGYWDHRDAAVVFKRIDKWTGDVRYIYHGNDGTSTPWNDTAQLNFMLPEVREAVIQMILHVARKFPIIRFDAAMTLAKKHYQRLWFPKPGEGGAIPSRAGFGLSRAEFDAAFPKEFWREVVDRVAAEVPDTLLLAEAFWLMEGYFVRTLGMHRVYNSAFMNMLKMEDNCKYRMTVKNVLEFSPEVLKRFVNFMNNPDEDTAIAQFGKGDKYFGVALMMVTMPGLPMFGHGQIEGYTEKYGMEYRKAYWDEQDDLDLIRRHEAEIFPLMRRRNLFSGAANFAFYDFNSSQGWVDENVFAYSNRAGDERAIILYNNAYNTTEGWIRNSTPINYGTGEETNLVSKNLAEALGLKTGDGYYYVFRDNKTKLQYIRSGGRMAEEGLYATLYGYQYHAFLDFREVHDSDGSWAELAGKLNGSGVPDMEETYKEFRLEPILGPFRQAVNAQSLRAIIDDDPGARVDFEKALKSLLEAVRNFTGAENDVEKLLSDLLKEIELYFGGGFLKVVEKHAESFPDIFPLSGKKESISRGHIILSWIIVRHLSCIKPSDENLSADKLARERMESWLVRKILHSAFAEYLGDDSTGYYDSLLVHILAVHDDLLVLRRIPDFMAEFIHVLDDYMVQQYLRVNQYDDKLWLNKEQLERLMGSLFVASAVRLGGEHKLTDTMCADSLQNISIILTAAEEAGYQLEKTIEKIKPSDSDSR
jgi:glycosidase